MGKIEGTKNLKFPVIDERVILNGSTRNRQQVDEDDLSLDGEFCQAVVKTILNYWVA